MKKVLGVILLIALVAGVGVWYFVSFHLDNMIRQRIEQVAGRSLDTRVSVGTVVTDIRNGSLTISDIVVANPPGFRNPNALTLKGIEAAIDYDTLDIRRLVIEQPEVVIEEIDEVTNVALLLEAVENEPAPTPAEEAGEPVLVIHHFRMNASRAAFESASLERYTDFELDAVELRDVRGTPREVGQQIARGILEEAVSAAALQMLKEAASEKIDEAAKKLEEIFRRD